jgi:hypothetical protein
VSRYYADRGDTPGRRLGEGSRELGLTGIVDLDEFTSVLAGRHPATGERLITARGSAGRVASLGAGTAARCTPQGEALYAVQDVARVLGWSQADVRAAITEGEWIVAVRLVAALAGNPLPTASEPAATVADRWGRPTETLGRDAGSSRDDAPPRLSGLGRPLVADRDETARVPRVADRGPGRARAAVGSWATSTTVPVRTGTVPRTAAMTGGTVPAPTRPGPGWPWFRSSTRREPLCRRAGAVRARAGHRARCLRRRCARGG